MNREDNRSPGRGLTPRLIVGLTIMTAGVALALDNLGIVDSGVFFRYWPLAFVVLGIIKLTAAPTHQSGGAFWVILGVALLAFTTGHLNFQRVWALLLVFVGGSIAWRALRPRPVRAEPSSGIDMMAILGGSKIVNSSPDFQGGQALAIMGGCDVDLRKATIIEEEAVLDVFAFWGGVQLQVPEEWEVDNRISCLLGGIEDKTHTVPGSKQRLVLTGTVFMGGAEVKN
jgi:predicted membrane protein